MTSDAETSVHMQLADLARDMHAHVPEGSDDVLETVTQSAVEVVPGAVAAGVTLVSKKDQVTTVGGTNSDATVFDQLQRRHGEGPCLAAAWSDEMVQVSDFGTDTRWPTLGADVVADTAIRASVSYRLFTSEQGLGALNVYSDHPGPFSTQAIELGYSLATYAALVVDAARRHEQFVSALASRDIIGQAKGMIMERFNVDATRAFELLRKLSQDSNTPVADLARQVIAADHPEK